MNEQERGAESRDREGLIWDLREKVKGQQEEIHRLRTEIAELPTKAEVSRLNLQLDEEKRHLQRITDAAIKKDEALVVANRLYGRMRFGIAAEAARVRAVAVWSVAPQAMLGIADNLDAILKEPEKRVDGT